MSSTLHELSQMQRAFDSCHGTGGRLWSEPIDASSLCVLLELTVALAGEVGEFANLTKKIVRGDYSLDSAKPELGSELADVFIYLLKLADQLGIDLEAAFRTKLAYNEERFKSFLILPRTAST
jgi:NTP pyrophosphatase (non-canonical NTP hydrolase)